ncbi:MAG: type II toxin-antitoxin system RelE/ParE family toxin [Planctomycetota bacterium]
MSRYEVADRASADLDRQFDYLIEAACSFAPAVRLSEGFREKASLYADNPDLGSRDVAADPNSRAFLFGTPSNPRGWIAFYRPIEDGIEVLRVFRGERDFLNEI